MICHLQPYRVTVTFISSQLFGAATMNNTLCLAVFMALVYFRDLEWYYGAEVLCIVLVQWIVGIISLSKTYRVCRFCLSFHFPRDSRLHHRMLIIITLLDFLSIITCIKFMDLAACECKRVIENLFLKLFSIVLVPPSWQKYKKP